MRNYIKPSAEVVELSVKEPVSLLKKVDTTKTFGFGSKVNKKITLVTYSEEKSSQITG